MSSLSLLAADWDALADQATVVGVLVALLVGISTTIVMIRQEKATRDGQQLEREQAQAAAARTEAAAALTEEYTRRVVDALETMASHADSSGAPRVPSVRWSLVNRERDRYFLTNEGDAAARNVRVSAHETLALLGLDDAAQDVGPGEAIEFIAARTFGTRDSTITVAWEDVATGEERTWRYPLP